MDAPWQAARRGDVRHTVTPGSLVLLRTLPRLVAPNLKPDTKFTKNAKRTKNGEGHEEDGPAS